MLGHFSRSELAFPTTDQVRLAAGFGEALERLRNQYTSTAPAGRRQTGQSRDNIVPYLFP